MGDPDDLDDPGNAHDANDADDADDAADAGGPDSENCAWLDDFSILFGISCFSIFSYFSLLRRKGIAGDDGFWSGARGIVSDV